MSDAHGIDAEVMTDELSRFYMTVDEAHTNGMDVCHGGVVFLLGDTAAALAANTGEERSCWVTASSTVTFTAAARKGDVLTATCRPRWSGTGRLRIYDVDVVDQRGRTVALLQCQMLRTRPVGAG